MEEENHVSDVWETFNLRFYQSFNLRFNQSHILGFQMYKQCIYYSYLSLALLFLELVIKRTLADKNQELFYRLIFSFFFCFKLFSNAQNNFYTLCHLLKFWINMWSFFEHFNILFQKIIFSLCSRGWVRNSRGKWPHLHLCFGITSWQKLPHDKRSSSHNKERYLEFHIKSFHYYNWAHILHYFKSSLQF